MKLIAYLNFAGNCRDAFAFYQKVLGGSIEAMVKHGEAPEGQEVPDDWRDKIINAHLVGDGFELMGCDAPPEYFQKMAGITVSLQVEDRDRAERIFEALAEGGSGAMPFGETSWSRGFGMVTDKFGTPWMVNTV